jgi:hypothetical protein
LDAKLGQSKAPINNRYAEFSLGGLRIVRY